jgi:glycosyltransferase involved in cell wall biosynthesis
MPEINPAADSVTGSLVSRDPLIVWGPSLPPELAGPGTSLAPYIGNRRAYFLISPSWTREIDNLVSADIEHFAALRARWPEHRHIMLCNTRMELENYKKAGCPSIVCTANAFLNENTFDIAPNRRPEFDAIYNAQLVPFKRHELCTGIDSLALIYHRYSDPEKAAGYPDRVRAMLPRATFVNELDGPFRLLKEAEVAAWLGRARVGLILSKVEGQNRATAEYLLCGLPVVSTPNIGGRNRVLHPDYSIEAEPDPRAVAEAVARLIARRLDPRLIRRGVLGRLEADRKRLIQLIAAIFDAEGRAFPADADWRELFRRGAWPVHTVERLFAGTAVAETKAAAMAWRDRP